jgi:mRNA export factor
MAGIFGGGASSAATSTQGDLSKDVEIPPNQLPSDSISDMAFSPAADYLAVASWDKKCYIYEVAGSGATGKWVWEMASPVLSVAWSKDGTRVAAGSGDGKVAMLDLRTAPQNTVQVQATQVAQHDDAVKTVRWFTFNGADYLVTGSWDKKVRFWDLRSAQPVAELNASERVYSMDVKNDLLVVGTAERHIHMVDLKDPSKIYKTITSPLKWQTRVVSCFTDATGFAVGSIEGRCAIQYVEEKDTSLNFSFKCHRQADQTNRDVAKVYSVNAISFHPVHGTFSTAGSDGTFHFWDKDAKHRLKGYPEVGGSITATSFNHNGTIFAYAISYDWSKGYAFNSPNLPIKIKLHPIAPEECKPRPGSKKR